MAEISFSHDAAEDLISIKKYISEELCSEEAAKKTINSILSKIRILSDFPEIGAPLSSVIDLDVPYRFLVCGNYTAFYKIEDKNVYIIRILFGRRNFMQILFGNNNE
ncbi:MAG: type II toxin-antitoxin system RelE/ParE family toxin [Clostridia bacterium]|nr:type II toxin-antitoxin system RelE/ParE family toxin [Clostridia bacterium]